MNYATIKYNSSGDEQWVQRYKGPKFQKMELHQLHWMLGNVYVTGYSNSSPINSDFATIKYNSSGDSVWLVRYNGPGNYSDDKASSIAVDVSGNVYVTGAGAGNGTGSEFVTIKYSQSTGISQLSSVIPEQYILSQNYPNPFNPITNLEFGISDLGFVSLKVYDILGKEIKTLINENLNPGNYEIVFDGKGFPSGVYFYRLTAGEFTETKRMMLVK
ncbi:MAG: T9SS type A sorting domain-containing protein [Ignavibacteria bacterium]|nr:T9SS type A sorting domain-containing protein [Ignavibacteria bacterium]